jgi:hypothetical protein
VTTSPKPISKSLTTWLRETPPAQKMVGVRLTFRANVLHVARYHNRQENLYLAGTLLTALLGRNPFKKNKSGISEFDEEGGSIEYFRPHDLRPEE